MDASQLEISVEEQERWRRRISVTVPASVVRDEERKAAKQLASRANLKGFRKGKVPTRVIESRFSGALRQEALDRLINDAYRQALSTRELKPISEGEVQDVQYQPEQDLSFSVAFDVQPVIELARLSGFSVQRPSNDVSDDQVDQVLTRIREQNGTWAPAAEGLPTSGDLVSVSIKRLDEGEESEPRDYDFVIGQGDALPDIEAAIQTLEAGQEGDFEVGFPDDFPDEGRRGVKEKIHVVLRQRSTLALPDLDDGFAKQLGDFESVDDLKSKVRSDIEKEAADQAENAVRSRLVDLILDANPFEVPASMVDRYVATILGDTSDTPPERVEQVRGQIRPQAERAVKRMFVIDLVAETQGLEASPEDVDAKIEEIAAANETTPAKVYAALQKAGRLDSLERELTEQKVFEFLKEQSEITT